MSDATLPEVPSALLDQVLAGWSLHLSANGGSLAQTKAAEIAIRDALAYARERAKTTVTINGREFQVVEWSWRDRDPGDEGTEFWHLYARPIPDSPVSDAPEEG